MTARDFSFPVKVYYEDTDASGVVYHARYLHFMERARTEWLHSHDIYQTELSSRYGIVFAVSEMEIKYLAPARYEDQLAVDVVLKKLGRVSMNLEQRVVENATGRELVRASVRVASVAADGFRPLAMPKEICRQILGQ